eukprot:834667-Rhodomonas_salina.1
MGIVLYTNPEPSTQQAMEPLQISGSSRPYRRKCLSDLRLSFASPRSTSVHACIEWEELGRQALHHCIGEAGVAEILQAAWHRA